MRSRFYLLLILLITLAMRGSSDVYSAAKLEVQPYIEPALLSAETDTLEIIVTAGDSQQAAENVEAAGGQVSGDLWLVDAVAATLPRNVPGR